MLSVVAHQGHALHGGTLALPRMLTNAGCALLILDAHADAHAHTRTRTRMRTRTCTTMHGTCLAHAWATHACKNAEYSHVDVWGGGRLDRLRTLSQT
eukprot:366568-Chlamydomonas_euryale.AAC.13